MPVDKTADRPGEGHHNKDRDDDGYDHDLDVIDHADRGDDGIERKNKIQQKDLNDHSNKGRNDPVLPFLLILHGVVNFTGALGQQEKSAHDQDEGAAAQVESRDGEERLGQVHDPGK